MTTPPLSEHDELAPAERSALRRLVAVNASVRVITMLLGAPVSLLSVGLTSRYLSVAEFGQMMSALSLATVIAMIAGLGVEQIAIRQIARAPERAPQLAADAFILTTALGTLAAAVTVAVGAALYGAPPATIFWAIAIFAATAPLNGLRIVGESLITARDRTFLLGIVDLGSRLLVLVLTVLVIVLKGSLLVIVAAQATATLAAAVALFAIARPQIGMWSLARIADLKFLFVAAIPAAVIVLFNTLYYRIDLLMLSKIGGSTAAGAYALAYKFVDMGIPIAGFVMAALLPTLSREHGWTARFETIIRTAEDVLQWLAGGLVVIAPAAPLLLVVLGGEKYVSEWAVLTLLLLGLAFACCQQAFGFACVALGRQARLAWVSAAVLIINIVLNLIMIPVWGPTGAAVGLAASEGLSLILTVWACPGATVAIALPRPALIPPVLLGTAIAAGGHLGGGPTSTSMLLCALGGVLVFVVLSLVTGVLPRRLPGRRQASGATR